MRKFTQNDLDGLAKAFQTFMSHANGQQVYIKTHKSELMRALQSGITIDELFNIHNYRRTAEVIPQASVKDYVDKLLDCSICINTIRADYDPQDETTKAIIADVFHSFYVFNCNKGGQYTTPNAINGIMKAVLRFSLQTVCSEELMCEVAKHLDGDVNAEKITCFKYIQELITNQENYNALDEDTDSLTEEQQARFREQTAPVEEEIHNIPEDEDGKKLSTEGAPWENDGDIYCPDLKEMEYEDNADEEPYSPKEETFFMSVSPKIMKLNAVKQMLSSLLLSEIQILFSKETEDIILDEFITNLVDGKYTLDMSDTRERELYLAMNGNLLPQFVECLKRQGREVDETTVAKIDLIKTEWDLRDYGTRVVQKLRELVLADSINEIDAEVLSAINDLEDFYKKKRKEQQN